MIDKIIAEPLGGAHRDPPAMANSLKKALADALKNLQDKPVDKLVVDRQKRLLQYGKFKELDE